MNLTDVNRSCPPLDEQMERAICSSTTAYYPKKIASLNALVLHSVYEGCLLLIIIVIVMMMVVMNDVSSLGINLQGISFLKVIWAISLLLLLTGRRI